MNEIIDWDEIIKKEARGLDDYDLGEVQDLNEQFVEVWFSVTKDEAKAYKHD